MSEQLIRDILGGAAFLVAFIASLVFVYKMSRGS